MLEYHITEKSCLYGAEQTGLCPNKKKKKKCYETHRFRSVSTVNLPFCYQILLYFY